MAKRKVEAAPEGKVELASPFAATAQENAAVRQVSAEERLSALEATVSALIFSTFGARDSQGKLLQRCACGVFATRRVAILHPVAGTHFESLCEECSPRSPLAGLKDVPREEQELLAPADKATVKRVNQDLNRARLWGNS